MTDRRITRGVVRCAAGPRHYERDVRWAGDADLIAPSQLDEMACAVRDAALYQSRLPGVAIRQCSVHVSDQVTDMAQPAGYVRRIERRVAMRLVIEGVCSLVPVDWQFVGAESPINALERDFCHGWLRDEVVAAARASRLDRPTHCAVVLEPWLSSMVIHECIGHTSEADNYATYNAHRRVGEPGMGDLWTTLELDVTDDPTLPGHRGSYTHDDEGTEAIPTPLVRGGRWVGLLHNRLTGSNGQPGANGRRVFGLVRTLPRMSITYAGAGTTPVEALFARVADGVYCGGTWGGGSNGMQFVIRPAFGRRIRDGVLTDEYVRGFDLAGDKRTLFRNLTGISDHTHLFDPVHGCDKMGQDGLPVTLGAPHLAFHDACLLPVSK